MKRMSILTFSLIVFFILEVSVAIILYLIGFRITYSPDLETSWDAVSAFGQWAGAIIGIFIPIAAVYIQSELNQNKMEIGA